MSALAEALTAAQARAIGTLEKAYLAGAFEDDRMHKQLDALGCTDAIDQDRLIECLDVLRAYGGSLPAEPRPAADEPATERQLSYLASLLNDAGLNPEREITAGLTKDRASQLIEQVKAGTYEPVPF